mgnify:CR=1 FL=1
MSKKIKLGLIGVLVLCILGLGIYYYQVESKKNDKLSEQLKVGTGISQVAPDFTLTNFEGGEVALSDYRGKYVVLNFWATWCPPCREEMPNLNQFYEENKNDFVVLAVDLGESKQKVQQFISYGGYTFPVLLDKDRRIGSRYNVSVIPTSYFIGPQGKIKYIKKGGLSMAELNKIKQDIQK